MDFICGYCMGVKWICEVTPCPGRQAAIDARLREARRIKSPRSEFRHSRTECSMSGQRFLVSCCEMAGRLTVTSPPSPPSNEAPSAPSRCRQPLAPLSTQPHRRPA